MHLPFENVVPKLMKHYRGVFFGTGDEVPANAGGADEDTDASGEHEPTVRAGSGLKRKQTELPPRRGRKKKKPEIPKGRDGKQKKAPEKKFIERNEPWNIPPNKWLQISADIDASNATFPGQFGPHLINFAEHCHHMTAAQWRTWTFHLGPILLKPYLPQEDYNEVVSFTQALLLLCAYKITPAELDEVEERLLRFGSYWENRFVNQRWDKLHACLPTLHQLRHCAETIRWDRPMVGYAQWSMEILNGIVNRATKSRVQANASIAIRGLLCEQENHLSYVLELPDLEAQEGEDEGEALSRILTEQIERLRQPDTINLADIPPPELLASDSDGDSGPNSCHTFTDVYLADKEPRRL